jgi:hypothetical protein
MPRLSARTYGGLSLMADHSSRADKIAEVKRDISPAWVTDAPGC